MRVFLARHGETEWNAEHRLQGRSNTRLTARGAAHAQSLAELLHDQELDAIFTSTLERTIDTAQPLAAARGLAVEARPELVELAYGELEGRTPADPDPEIRRLWKCRKDDPLGFRAPGGETYEDLVSRVAPFVDEIGHRFPGGTVVIVGHRATNRALMNRLLGMPLDECLRFEHEHETVLEIRAGKEPAIIEHRYASLGT